MIPPPYTRPRQTIFALGGRTLPIEAEVAPITTGYRRSAGWRDEGETGLRHDVEPIKYAQAVASFRS